MKYLTQSWQALKRHYNHYASMGLGLGLFIVSLIISLSLIAGFRQQATPDNLDRLVHIQSGSNLSNSDSELLGRPRLAATIGAPAVLTDADLQTVINHPDSLRATPVSILNQTVSNLDGHKLTGGHLLVVGHYFLDAQQLALRQGNNPLGDNNLSVVIGDLVAQELFKTDQPLSYEIVIGETIFLVGGVLQPPQTVFDPLGIDYDWRRAVLIPYEAYQDLQLAEEAAELTPEPLIYKIIAQVPLERQAAFIDNLERQLQAAHPSDNFEVFSAHDLTLGQVAYKDALYFILAALIVMTALIFNVLLWHNLQILKTSLRDKYLEIVISHIVGALKRQIILPTFYEALLACLLVGSLASLSALLLIWGLNTSTDLIFVLSWPLFGYSFSVSLITGLIIGGWTTYLINKQRLDDYHHLSKLI